MNEKFDAKDKPDLEIRPFAESDFEALGAFYDAAVKDRRLVFWWVGEQDNWPNVFGAFEQGRLVGKGQVEVLAIMPPESGASARHRIFFNIKTLPERAADAELLGALYARVHARALELKRELPAAHGAMLCFGNYAEETANTDYFAGRGGFAPLNKQFLMRRELDGGKAQPIETRELPDGYAWRAFDKLTDEQKEQYLALDREIWPETTIGPKRLEDMMHQPGWRLLQIEADGEPAASLMYWIEEEDTGEIDEVFVREPHRRRGLASALLARALEEIRAAGCSEAELDVETLNDSALRTYTSAGFRIVTEEQRYGVEL
ncbi:GNAT family N-acetyltransferase [Saccharibacillus sp. CPCC 101409]|uniref:GNAT family N-acetyltransferase n=1 Tax=Saccharibacillus sp. CPCC 101409 TaxID=3058041 RepID=UPI002673E0A0|nr:GNAT family N-acetyltransferase [Saccharibacillus sp. CPCC 101409]MDO3411176.1 GNAT family N-acetyltransferase [Saccharibacillus sp. CPCC 101409]